MDAFCRTVLSAGHPARSAWRRKASLVRVGLIFGLVIMTCVSLPCTGGLGITLPYNLLSLVWVASALLWLTREDRFTAPQSIPLLMILGSVCLAVPWLLRAWDADVVVLLLAMGSGWLLSRYSLSPCHRRLCLGVIFALALGQCAIALLQTFAPHLALHWYEYDWLRNHGRPYGIFLQVNLLASFLATGLGCGFLLLLITPCRRWLMPLTVGLGVIAFVLALNQSRAGALGAVSLILLLAGLLGTRAPRRTFAALATMGMMALAGAYITQHVTVMVNGEPYLLARDYAGSTRARWHILAITWQMIMEKPWTGWGYGTFEYAFSRWVLAHPRPDYVYSSIVTHPHNEVLYAWFQGGVTALAGMLLLCAGWVQMVYKAWRESRVQTGYALLAIPLLVHLNLEYPFYQSFIHFGLFIMLLRLCVADRPAPTRHSCNPWQRTACSLAGVALVAFSLIALYANQQLTKLERAGLVNFPQPAPWYFASQGERARFDEHVALLVDYNRTHDPANLAAFMTWAEAYSQRHNDKNVWRSMIMIEQFRGDEARAKGMYQVYQQLFPEPSVQDDDKQKHRP